MLMTKETGQGLLIISYPPTKILKTPFSNGMTNLIKYDFRNPEMGSRNQYKIEQYDGPKCSTHAPRLT
jgi:hypothetical protein